jgi:hypothetical protein
MLLVIITFLIRCEKNDNSIDIFEVDNFKEYYKDLSPDVKLFLNDSALIDIDKNGTQDVIFMRINSGDWVDRVNDSINISIGKFIGSGSANVDTITYNEIIDNAQEWYYGINLFTQTIKYIGVKKSFDNQSLFGWIKIDISDSIILIDSYYFRKENSIIVRAGIYKYN